eukprot:scaffold1347_cov350-Pavlova_lutheri.AAC.50
MCCSARAVEYGRRQGHSMLKREEMAGCYWGRWATQWIGVCVGQIVSELAQETLAVALHTQ